MYEDHEGDFSYSIKKHRFRNGKAGWIWQVHHVPSGSFVEGGTSLRSHDHAKTAACDSIFAAELKARPVMSLAVARQNFFGEQSSFR